ncbi:MAG: hypothetical protein WBZ19_21495 [Chthoniobacterales bacterium]
MSVRSADLRGAAHATEINQFAIVEAFPSAFLGVLLTDPLHLQARRGDRSDVFFRNSLQLWQASGTDNLPIAGQDHGFDLTSVVNHDDRAALVCAFTALCVAADDFVAVGDGDGWIVLPLRRAARGWAVNDLKKNAEFEEPGCLYVNR